MLLKKGILDLETAHASEIWAKYINRHTGRRSDAATGKLDENTFKQYLNPACSIRSQRHGHSNQLAPKNELSR